MRMCSFPCEFLLSHTSLKSAQLINSRSILHTHFITAENKCSALDSRCMTDITPLEIIWMFLKGLDAHEWLDTCTCMLFWMDIVALEFSFLHQKPRSVKYMVSILDRIYLSGTLCDILAHKLSVWNQLIFDTAWVIDRVEESKRERERVDRQTERQTERARERDVHFRDFCPMSTQCGFDVTAVRVDSRQRIGRGTWAVAGLLTWAATAEPLNPNPITQPRGII